MNSSYTGSSVEEDQKNTENGTWNEYDRIAISDFIYAAKEVCGPIAYNGKGVTAAWLRIAKPAKMKKYPNHTMMGELQGRLYKLKKALASCPSNFVLKRKIEDLEKMLAISDLQRKLQHQKSVMALIPSSSYMKSCVEKTEVQLTAAVLLAPAVERAPDPAQEAAQDEVPSVQKVGEMQTQVDALQSKVAELSKKRHVINVSVQHLATSNCVPIQKRFKEEILKDRVKLLDLVQSTFKKEHEDSMDEDIPDEDTASIDAPAHAIESTEEKYVPDAVLKEMNKDEEDVNMEYDSHNEGKQVVSEASLQVGLDTDKVTDMSKPLSVKKTSPVDKSGEAINDDEEVESEDEEIPDKETEVDDEHSEKKESIEEKESKENHPKKNWKKTLRMKLIQLMRRKMKKGSDFLSNQKDPPGKSAAGPNVTLSSSSLESENEKLQHEANLLSSAAANSKPLADFAPNINLKIELGNYSPHPISEVEGNVKLSDLRAETDTKGEIIKKILAIEKSDEAEVQIKTLALLQKFLDSHANPKGGYEVKENMA